MMIKRCFSGLLFALVACGGTGPAEPTSQSLQRNVQPIVQNCGTLCGIQGTLLPAKTVSFTYDDGPDEHTLELSAYLREQGIKATFFINGCRLQASPASPSNSTSCDRTLTKYPASVLNTLIADGHRVANHTEDHVELTRPEVTPADTLYQVKYLQTTYLDPVISDGFYLFRPPHNGWDPDAALTIQSDSSLNKLVGPIFFDAGGNDWYCFDPSNPNAGNSAINCGNEILNEFDNPDSGKDRGIIQMHDWLISSVGTPRALEMAQYLVPQLKARGFTFVPLDALPQVKGQQSFLAPQFWLTSEFTDARGWDTQASYYGSVHFADLDNDGRADVCGRHPLGLVCAKSTGTGFGAPTFWLTSEFTNNAGWLPTQYGSTLQLGDINGDGRADVCGRAIGGIRCALANSTGTAFNSATWWSSGTEFSDTDGWDASASYYGSLRLADVNGDGKDDLCGRAARGIICALSTGTSFLPTSDWLLSDFSDALNWREPKYGTTLQFGDLNNDGKADVCGRGTPGMKCALSTGTGFGPVTFWTLPGEFSDQDGFGVAESRYGSLSLADINGDGRADICGRNAMGLVCAVSNGTRFINYHYVQTDDYRDSLNWGPTQFGSTVSFADVTGDGKADGCARATGGIYCTVAP